VKGLMDDLDRQTKRLSIIFSGTITDTLLFICIIAVIIHYYCRIKADLFIKIFDSSCPLTPTPAPQIRRVSPYIARFIN